MVDTKKKILLADDEENIRILGQQLLNESGYDVILAVNGEEAISKAISEHPDLVITDIRMPKKNGFDVCKALRSDPVLSHVPILILSALGDEFNKITGFEGGANDFIVKPFRTEELKERVAHILAMETKNTSHISGQFISENPSGQEQISFVPSGIPALDREMGGGLPKGANILMIGALGRGKSSFARKFLAEGLVRDEKALYITVDDDPKIARAELNKLIKNKLPELEASDQFRLIDAYSWSAGEIKVMEKYKIETVLSLDQLSSLVSQAGADIGQSVQKKSGGRRVIDSISSFFVNFELPAVQRFLTQISRTSISFGGVTSLFIVEEGAVNEQVLNNIRYHMDGILEFREEAGKKKLRVVNMKWGTFSKEWINW
jgi:CheY-like chemotaxis protein/KaiC/GvpD/RAD55 family RecA-like ATPase